MLARLIAVLGVGVAVAGGLLLSSLSSVVVVVSASSVPLARGGLGAADGWTQPAGEALLALGAGSTAAAVSAVVLRGRPANRAVALIPLIGGAAAAAGAVALRTTLARPAAFGWTAYSPLSGAVYLPPSTAVPDAATALLLAAGAGACGAALSALRPPRA